MTKRRTAIITLFGLLVGMIVGAPLWGAVSSAFWSAGADTNDARRVANLLYAQTRLDPSQAVLQGHVQTHRCGDDVHRLVTAGDVTLVSALDQHQRGLVYSRYHDLAVIALTSLPAPVLGAVLGCVNGSPAAHLCLSYASRVATKATTVPKATESSWLAAADREIEAAWCGADPASTGN